MYTYAIVHWRNKWLRFISSKEIIIIFRSLSAALPFLLVDIFQRWFKAGFRQQQTEQPSNQGQYSHDSIRKDGVYSSLSKKIKTLSTSSFHSRMHAGFPVATEVVQSLNSPFFPPHIGAEPGRAKEESRITCMRTLRTNQSKINGPNHAARVNVSRNAFFSSHSERKHFL